MALFKALFVVLVVIVPVLPILVSHRPGTCKVVCDDDTKKEPILRHGKRGPKGDKGDSASDSSTDVQFLKLKLKQLQEMVLIEDCGEATWLSGTSSTARLILPGLNSKVMNVVCKDGWTVIQRRFDGSVDFYRNWKEYVDGFGNEGGEYWLGLEAMNLLTSAHDTTLRVELESKDGTTAYAEYSIFQVGPSNSNYRLTIGGYKGTASDSLSQQNGMRFSTFDKDNDLGERHCAKDYRGAWWYRNCHASHLNGDYTVEAGFEAVYWYYWKSNTVGLKSTTMSIKRNE